MKAILMGDCIPAKGNTQSKAIYSNCQHRIHCCLAHHVNDSIRANNVDLKSWHVQNCVFILQFVDCLHKQLDSLSLLQAPKKCYPPHLQMSRGCDVKKYIRAAQEKNIHYSMSSHCTTAYPCHIICSSLITSSTQAVKSSSQLNDCSS